MIVSIVAITSLLVYHFGYNKGKFFWPELKPQSKCYYISIITDDKANDANRIEALEMLIMFYGAKEGFPYALYLADYCSIPAACYLVSDCIEIFYDDLGLRLGNRPPLSVSSIILPYLKRGAEQRDERCITTLQIMYEVGLDVERNITLTHYYDSLYKSLSHHEKYFKIIQ